MTLSIYKQLVWDYDLSPLDFEAILAGKKSLGTLNQSWAIARILEHANYYEATDLVPIQTIKANWSSIKNRIFNPTIKHGYEYILHNQTLSTSR